VVAEESGPALAVGRGPAPHVSLHGALRDPDSKLEQLPSEAARRPTLGFAPSSRGSSRRVAVRPSGREFVTAIAKRKAETLPMHRSTVPAAPASTVAPARSHPPRQQRDRQALGRAREHHSLALHRLSQPPVAVGEARSLPTNDARRRNWPHHQPHESAEHRGRVSRGGGPWSRIGAVPESSQDGSDYGEDLLVTPKAPELRGRCVYPFIPMRSNGRGLDLRFVIGNLKPPLPEAGCESSSLPSWTFVRLPWRRRPAVALDLPRLLPFGASSAINIRDGQLLSNRWDQTLRSVERMAARASVERASR